MSAFEPPRVMTPVKATVYFCDPDANPSEFPKCVIRVEGAFLVINDLTKEKPRVGHYISSTSVDSVTCEEWMP